VTALAAAEHLVVEFAGGGRVLRAVDEVSFEIAPGEALGVVGESGSGKSTLARALLGLVRPDRGRTLFRGADFATLAAGERRRLRRHLAIVFQNPASSFDPRRTIGESVGEPLAVHEPGLGRAARAGRVAAMLERTGLDAAFATRRPHELSGGQCQRAAIARAMITAPELVVCDEVVSALDVSVQAQIVNLLLELKRERGVAYLFISHNLAVVRRIASRVLVLYRGRVVEDAPRDALYAEPRHPYTRLLLDSVPSLEAAVPGVLRVPPEAASPFERASGCVFAGRCPHALARCSEVTPALEPVGPAHAVACLRWRDRVAARGR
jgi:oligopeptide/dipeptide ABC transporter ATP-binding protein